MRLDEINKAMNKEENQGLSSGANIKRLGGRGGNWRRQTIREVEGKLRVMSLKPSEELYPRGENDQLSDAARQLNRNVQFKLAISNLFTKAMILLASFLTLVNF